VRIGTVDIPDRMDRGRYFAQMSYLELSALFGGPQKPSALTKWAEIAPKDSIGLVAPFPLTHRKPPSTSKAWAFDATSGDFRASAPGQIALAALHDAVVAVAAHCVVFRSPPLFAPSATNRDLLKAFFADVCPPELLGVERVWMPDGLWNVRTAVKLATELGVTCAFDPLVRDPGEPPEIYEDLDAPRLYLRIEGLGRAGGMRAERFDDLAVLLEHYEGRPITVAFASPQRWHDARNFKKLLTA
jgi:uncharacterized protein YecE (DUF72 family)